MRSAPSGSRSCVASSTSSTGGAVSSARATDSRFCMPCDQPPIGRSATSVSPTSSSTSARAGEGGAPAQAVQAGEEDQVLGAGDAQVERAVAGRDEPDAPARGAAALARAEHAHAALGRVDEPGEHAQQCGLAGAVRAEQSVHLARAGGEVDTRQRLACAVAANEAANLDGGRLGT